MGFFTGAKSILKKTEAAVLVQTLLEHEEVNGFFDLDPAATANKFIEDAWELKPKLFDGNYGQRPHKVAVAAFALADGALYFRGKESNQIAMTVALGNILGDIEENESLYPFNKVDYLLIKSALEMHSEIAHKYKHNLIQGGDEFAASIFGG